MSFFKKIIYFIWTLPQTLLGAILYIYNIKVLHYSRVPYKNCRLILWKKSYTLTLGSFIFLNYQDNYINWNIVSHEYGHYIQSLFTGPFYLLGITLPSVIWSLLHKSTFFKKKKYTQFFIENWASTLGEKYTNLQAIRD